MRGMPDYAHKFRVRVFQVMLHEPCKPMSFWTSCRQTRNCRKECFHPQPSRSAHCCCLRWPGDGTRAGGLTTPHCKCMRKSTCTGFPTSPFGTQRLGNGNFQCEFFASVRLMQTTCSSSASISCYTIAVPLETCMCGMLRLSSGPMCFIYCICLLSSLLSQV